jgi:hypothetical protein
MKDSTLSAVIDCNIVIFNQRENQTTINVSSSQFIYSKEFLSNVMSIQQETFK